MDNKHQNTKKLARSKVQDYQKYSTDPADFQTWLDRVYSKLNFPTPIATALIGAIVYFLGLSMAATFDFGKEYIYTSGIYIGVIGICLVSGVVRYASLRIHSVFENLRPCFMIDDDTYHSFVKRWFSKLSSNGNLAIAGVYIVLALLVAYSEFFTPLNRVQYGATKAYFFEPFWYQPENLWSKTIIIAFYGICVALPLGTATRLLYLNYKFMGEVKKLPVVPLIKTIRIRFREIVDYYLYIFFTWSIGIGLFGIAFFKGLNIDSILFLSIMNVLGIGAFISPQLCYRSFILKSLRVTTNQSLKEYYSTIDINLRERPTSSIVNSEKLHHNGAIEISRESINWWIYDLPDIIFFMLAQLIVYGATFLQ
jgi:hypothetical protein